MSENTEWQIRKGWQPDPHCFAFDLEEALSSVVFVRTRIPEDAFTAPILGTERAGNGVIIDRHGLVLTIGYLVTEAAEVWLMGGNGRAAPGYVVAYDHDSGFGLVQALADLSLPPLPFGSSAALEVGESVVLAGCGGRERSIAGRVIGKREFAGYWEYVLDEALFTTPPHPSWGGAALIGGDGTLRGVGSLFIQQPRPTGAPIEANMVVPIDELKPIFDDLVTCGRVRRPARPWLGMYTAEIDETFAVAGVAESGPADRAGVKAGDRVLEIAGAVPTSLPDLFRRVWALGSAGVEVPITFDREGQRMRLTLASIDRNSILKSPQFH